MLDSAPGTPATSSTPRWLAVDLAPDDNNEVPFSQDVLNLDPQIGGCVQHGAVLESGSGPWQRCKRYLVVAEIGCQLFLTASGILLVRKGVLVPNWLPPRTAKVVAPLSARRVFHQDFSEPGRAGKPQAGAWPHEQGVVETAFRFIDASKCDTSLSSRRSVMLVTNCGEII